MHIDWKTLLHAIIDDPKCRLDNGSRKEFIRPNQCPDWNTPAKEEPDGRKQPRGCGASWKASLSFWRPPWHYHSRPPRYSACQRPSCFSCLPSSTTVRISHCYELWLPHRICSCLQVTAVGFAPETHTCLVLHSATFYILGFSSILLTLGHYKNPTRICSI